MKAIINTRLILEDGIVFDGALTYENGKIVALGEKDQVTIPADAEVIDAGGLYTAPGFIDIHVHGCSEYHFYDDPVACCEFFLSHGETTVLPTLYCDRTREQMLGDVRLIKESAGKGACRIIDGMYMEGPYMNGIGSGQKYILWTGEIKEAEFAPLVEAAKGFVRVWAIDPGREGIETFMRYVKEADPDAIFAYGHSNARFSDCRKVRKYGVKVQTHHNDSGKAPGFAQGTMGSGCDEYTLHEGDMYAELICDRVGVHVDPDLIKMLVRVKGTEHVILITDHATKTGDYTNNEADGIAYGPDLNYDYEGHLSGSRLTMDSAVRNLMCHTGYGLCHAVRMASLNPATMLGIEDRVGSLAPGKTANLLLMDDMVNIKTVILEGTVAAQNGELVL